MWLSFYEPRTYFEPDRPAWALAVLDVARAINPTHPRMCYHRARALAALHRIDGAVAALACFAGSEFASADALESDPNLAALRPDAAFGALVARLRERTSPP